MAFKIDVSADLVLAVSHAITEDKTRHYLNGVRFEAHEAGGITMVSTNGKIAIVAYDKAGTLSGGPITLRFTKEDFRALKRPAREKPYRLISSDRSEDLLEVTNAAGHSVRPIVLDVSTGEYPQWRRIIPTVFTKEVFHGFVPSQLAAISKAFTAAHPRQQKDLPLFFTTGVEGSILIRSLLEDVFAVAVPYRADKEHHTNPSWF